MDSRPRFVLGDPTLEFTEFENEGVVFKTDQYRISAGPVVHFTMDTWAMKVETEGASIVVTGDVGPNRIEGVSPRSWEPNRPLAEFSRDVDMMIIDAAHLPPRAIGQLAKEANPKTLVLSHFTVPARASNYPVGIFSNRIEGIQNEYHGEIIIAEDGKVLEMEDIVPRRIEKAANEPDLLYLGQNYPDPFTSGTEIHFQLFHQNRVKLVVTDSHNQMIRELLDEETPQGIYMVHWDGMNDHGEKVESGEYSYTIEINGNKETKGMTVE